MPRRLTPLSPDDPKARLALALRELRDCAGFDAKPIARIAAENKMPKSTLHAALRGERIPTVPVLAALVRAWGGDPVEWLKRRTETEQEIERLRLQAAALDSEDATADPKGLANSGTVTVIDGEVPVGADDATQPHVEIPGGSLPAPFARLNSGVRRPSSSVLDDVRSASDVENWKSHISGLPTSDLVDKVVFARGLDEDQWREIWTELRRRALAPPLRDIALGAGLSQQQVSLILRGKEAPDDRAVPDHAARLVAHWLEREARTAIKPRGGWRQGAGGKSPYSGGGSTDQ